MAQAPSSLTVEIPGLDSLASDLKRLAAAIDAHDNSTAGIAVRAIQLMREAGEQRDQYKATLDRVHAALEAAKDRGATGREFYDDLTAALPAPAAPEGDDHA